MSATFLVRSRRCCLRFLRCAYYLTLHTRVCCFCNFYDVFCAKGTKPKDCHKWSLSVNTSERTLVPVFVQRNIRQNHPFGNHPFGNPRKILRNFRQISRKIPCKRLRKIHQRAAAGAQGEVLVRLGSSSQQANMAWTSSRNEQPQSSKVAWHNETKAPSYSTTYEHGVSDQPLTAQHIKKAGNSENSRHTENGRQTQETRLLESDREIHLEQQVLEIGRGRRKGKTRSEMESS